MTTKLKTSDFWPMIGQLTENLSGEYGRGWLEATKRFLRKENPWPAMAPASGIIDLGANPFVPDGWAVEEHKKGGLFDVRRSKIDLFLSKKQKKGLVVGHDLRKELADQPVLNANVLDYLLEHPEFIPEAWKGKCVFLWATIYRDSDGHLYVRYLYWRGGRWRWDYVCLASGWGADYPAACAQASA